ncbi:hypothetical protein Rsub_02538 [Raphidocelis subcapitata]|uniref:GDT1 family protein n=1 Tax=Raphidocelis subcapitata TaxID=307507 RepID=A0A2V0NQD3_9CHLO|nr:hypothetical protein Rsub_02538 [Raphidocelis subcapitata]|eukprot:GBF89834.1 hypothetical protein Rsub_02538 [Raphidocelis subcapitata]
MAYHAAAAATAAAATRLPPPPPRAARGIATRAAAIGALGSLPEDLPGRPQLEKQHQQQHRALWAAAAALAVAAALAAAAATGAAEPLLCGPLARGFGPAFSLVFLSELGDKTFFLTAIFAVRLGRAVAFAGAMAGLSLVTLLSIAVGAAFAALPEALKGGVGPQHLSGVAPVMLAVFGLRSLREAWVSRPDGGSTDEGLEEAASAVAAAESARDGGAGGGGSGGAATAAAAAAAAAPRLGSKLFEVASMVFLAELGDRSMLSVMALGATPGLSTAGVAAGAMAAHGAAAAIAVVGGAVAGRHVSERVVNAVSGCLLLAFAAASALPCGAA